MEPKRKANQGKHVFALSAGLEEERVSSEKAAGAAGDFRGAVVIAETQPAASLLTQGYPSRCWCEACV